MGRRKHPEGTFHEELIAFESERGCAQNSGALLSLPKDKQIRIHHDAGLRAGERTAPVITTTPAALIHAVQEKIQAISEKQLLLLRDMSCLRRILFLLLDGPPGIGKSSSLELFTHILERNGFESDSILVFSNDLFLGDRERFAQYLEQCKRGVDFWPAFYLIQDIRQTIQQIAEIGYCGGHIPIERTYNKQTRRVERVPNEFIAVPSGDHLAVLVDGVNSHAINIIDSISPRKYGNEIEILRIMLIHGESIQQTIDTSTIRALERDRKNGRLNTAKERQRQLEARFIRDALERTAPRADIVHDTRSNQFPLPSENFYG